MRIPKGKSTDELLKMSKEDLVQYLRDSEVSVLDSDVISIMHVEHGTKILYFHENETKPYKTRVYLNKTDESELLK